MHRISQILFLNIVFLLSNGQAWAIEQYCGELRITSSQMRLFADGTARTIVAKDPDVVSALTKFKTGDIISGLGESQTDGTYLIQSIDYIGLKQLIGSWGDKNNIFAVIPNFSEMSFVSNPVSPVWDFRRNLVEPTHVRKFIYSVRPSTQDGFTLFLTDETQTQLAEINITGKVMVMKLFDPNNGELQSSFRFTKL